MKPLMIIAAASLSTPAAAQQACMLSPLAQRLTIEAATAAWLADRPGTDPATKAVLEAQALQWLRDINDILNGGAK